MVALGATVVPIGKPLSTPVFPTRLATDAVAVEGPAMVKVLKSNRILITFKGHLYKIQKDKIGYPHKSCHYLTNVVSTGAYLHIACSRNRAVTVKVGAVLAGGAATANSNCKHVVLYFCVQIF